MEASSAHKALTGSLGPELPETAVAALRRVARSEALGAYVFKVSDTLKYTLVTLNSVLIHRLFEELSDSKAPGPNTDQEGSPLRANTWFGRR